MVNPLCSDFREVTTNFEDVPKFRNFTVHINLSVTSFNTILDIHCNMVQRWIKEYFSI